MVRVLPAALLSLLAAIVPAAAATFDVDRTDDTAAATACTAAANDCSLRGAIITANATAGMDTINVPAGTYNLTVLGAAEDAAATGDLDITDDLVLAGAGAATTIIDGGQFDRVFHSDPGGTGTISVTIHDVTVQGGATVVISFVLSDGGAIRNGTANTLGSNTAGTLTIMNSVVRNSSTPRAGGGIANVGALVLIDTVVTGNTAGTLGGGIFQDDPGSLSLTGTTVSGNTASQTGGGIFSGLFSVSANPLMTLNTSTISGNTGEGIYLNRGSMNLFDSTVSGNSGAAIVNTSGSANVKMGGSTVTGNASGVSTGNTFIALNSILAGNTGGDCSGTLTTLGYNLIQNNSCTFVGNPATSILGQAAQLGPLADNGGPTRTHALLAGSPAIDAGNPATPGSGGNACDATDQRGTTRPQPAGGTCDIGAFELVQTTTTTTTSTSTTSTSTSTSTTLPPICQGGTTISKATLVVKKLGGTAGDEQLLVKGSLDFSAGTPATLSPSTKGAQLLLEDLGAGDATLFGLTYVTKAIPPGAPGTGCSSKDGWKKLGYKNVSNAIDPPTCTAASADGLKGLRFKDKRAKKKAPGIAFSAKTKGSTIATPVGPLRLTVVLGGTVTESLAGECGVHVFATSSCTKKGTTLKCR